MSESEFVRGPAMVAGYLAALESNESSRILRFFAPDAIVISPTYGVVRAAEFYPKLCFDTLKAEIDVRTICAADDDPRTVFAYFDYLWTLKDGTAKHLEVVDIFRLSGQTIGSLRIFADGLKASKSQE